MPDRPFLRGETLRGTVHITTDRPDKKEIEVVILTGATYPREAQSIRFHSFVHVALTTEKVDILPPGKEIQFQYTIPEDAPYTFDSGILRINWKALAFLGYKRTYKMTAQTFTPLPSCKLKPNPKIGCRDILVLPHVLKSESPPAYTPIPVCKKHSTAKLSRPFHSWRYTGSLHKSKNLDIHVDQDHYSPGDRGSGTLYFSTEVEDADLKVYLVFLSKRDRADIAEEEQVIAEGKGTFYKGSSFHFSFEIPEPGFPTFEMKHCKMQWIVRAVVSKKLRFTTVAEQKIKVVPLIF